MGMQENNADPNCTVCLGTGSYPAMSGNSCPCTRTGGSHQELVKAHQDLHDAQVRIGELMSECDQKNDLLDLCADEKQKLENELDLTKCHVEELERMFSTPVVDDFMKALPLEAAYQQKKWGTSHDAGKSAEDWIFLVGYLLGKAREADKRGTLEKALHHTITAAAACLNWHRYMCGDATGMRPGIQEHPDESGS